MVSATSKWPGWLNGSRSPSSSVCFVVVQKYSFFFCGQECEKLAESVVKIMFQLQLRLDPRVASLKA